jgi:hypothetical protein
LFARQWVAEPSLYQVTTPSFDDAGNLYMTPLLPHEPILMVSLDPDTGARRFVVPLGPGQRGGGAVPLVLRDPEAGGEVVYAISYERLIATRTDGTPVWDMPSGLGAASAADQSPIGLSYVPSADAIVGLTRDGFVYLLDRRTGAPLLTPVQLPGSPTPPAPSNVTPALAAAVNQLLAPLVAFPPEFGVAELIQVLLGGNSKVANNLSVDARRARLWIAASAPRRRGRHRGRRVSQLGAVYRYDVVRDGDAWTLAEICHRNFGRRLRVGRRRFGQDGARVYLGGRVRRAHRDRRGDLRRSVGGAARRADLRVDRGGLGRRRAVRGVRQRDLPGSSTRATTAGAAGPRRSTSTRSRPI